MLVRAMAMALLTLFSFFEFTYASTVTCKPNNGSWFPYNSAGQVIGDSQNGYSNQADCKEVLASQHGNLVCAWNGATYQFFNSINGKALGIDNPKSHFRDFDSCNEAIKMQPRSGSFICGWNAGHWAPYNRTTNKLLSGYKMGWPSLDECLDDSLKRSSDTLICGWDQQAVLYHASGKSFSLEFKDLNECNGFVDLAKSEPNTPALVKLLQSAKSDTQVLTGFINGTPDNKVGFPWKKCEVKNHAYHLTQSKNGYLTPECSPDTLYSWGGYDKLFWFHMNLKDNTSWPTYLPRTLYLTPSAAGTFGYGNIPMRFKIRSSVKYKLFVQPKAGNCDDLVTDGYAKKSEFPSTIFLRYDQISSSVTIFDFMICSPKVIESWSFGTKEHYDEILRDHKWMTTKNYYFWEGYSKTDGVDDYIGTTVDSKLPPYNTDFSMSSFLSKMKSLKAISEASFGRISAPANEASNKAEHFKTTRPIYFNPN